MNAVSAKFDINSVLYGPGYADNVIESVKIVDQASLDVTSNYRIIVVYGKLVWEAPELI